jgi:hypothetical protein
VERRHVAAAHARGVDERHAVGQAHEVHVGEGDGDLPTEPTPIGDARHGWRVADVLMPGAAPLAGALALAERDQHAVAGLPVPDVRADLLDHAAELVAEDVGRRDLDPYPRPVPGPEVPVGAADPVGLDADHGTVGGRRRIGHVADDERLADSFEDGGAHGRTLLTRVLTPGARDA